MMLSATPLWSLNSANRLIRKETHPGCPSPIPDTLELTESAVSWLGCRLSAASPPHSTTQTVFAAGMPRG